jgi:hypothetical protein
MPALNTDTIYDKLESGKIVITDTMRLNALQKMLPAFNPEDVSEKFKLIISVNEEENPPVEYVVEAVSEEGGEPIALGANIRDLIDDMIMTQAAFGDDIITS